MLFFKYPKMLKQLWKNNGRLLPEKNKLMRQVLDLTVEYILNWGWSQITDKIVFENYRAAAETLCIQKADTLSNHTFLLNFHHHE